MDRLSEFFQLLIVFIKLYLSNYYIYQIIIFFSFSQLHAEQSTSNGTSIPSIKITSVDGSTKENEKTFVQSTDPPPPKKRRTEVDFSHFLCKFLYLFSQSESFSALPDISSSNGNYSASSIIS